MEPTKVEKIDITPDKSIYHKIGEANYSISDAVAELVDNSIDAANEEGVEVYVILDKRGEKIIIEDNGRGMNKESAAKSLVLAHSKKHDALGEFGLGLKSACSSLGARFTISTTEFQSSDRFILSYDKAEFLKSENWNDYPMEIVQAPLELHGTTIEITKLRIKLYDALVTRLKDDLSKRYGPYILHNNVVIKVGLGKNSAKACAPIEPQLVEKTRTEFKHTLSNGREIHGWYGLLMVGSQKQSGFSLFRRNRLIKSAEKLGYSYHPSVMHIAGEINLDPIPVTHNKREFIWESGEFKEFIEKFWGDQTEIFLGRRVKGKIDEIKKMAIDKSNAEKSEEMPQQKRETIKDKLLQALNRVDEFKELAFPDLKQAKRSKDGQSAELETRDKNLKVAREETPDDVNQVNDQRVPKKTQPKKAKFIMVGGKKFRFDFFLENLGNDTIDKETIITEDQIIEVYINIGFKGYLLVKDTEFYTNFHIAEAIAEIYVKESKLNAEKIFSLRNSLLYEVASVNMEEEEFKQVERQERELLRITQKKKEMETRKEMGSL